MKLQLKIWVVVLLLAVFVSGCGCGGGGGEGGSGGTPAVLVSIEVTPANPSIALGTTQQFTATGIFSDNSSQDLTNSVTWSSADTSIATISNQAGAAGLASSQAIGSTTITATSGSVSGSTSLTVTAGVLVSITVTPPNPIIAKGMQQQFTAIGTFADNTTQDITNSVVWSLSDNSIATISNTAGSRGLATGVAVGSTSIIATSGSVSGSTTLTVTAAALVSITVTPPNPSIAKGTHQQFTAIGNFTDNTTKDITNSVVWSPSDNSIATISNTEGSRGLATGVAAGSTGIIATFGSVSGSATLTVTAATLASITVTPPNTSIVKGTQQQFTAIGTFTDNTTQDITNLVVWSLSDNSIATISNAAGSRGLATGVAAGSTSIIATSGSVSGSATLTVTAATLVSITVTPANAYVGFHTNVQYTAIGHFSDNTTQDITQLVTWSSSNTSVATISNQPGSKGLATTDGVIGMTVITATSGNISGSARLLDPNI